MHVVVGGIRASKLRCTCKYLGASACYCSVAGVRGWLVVVKSTISRSRGVETEKIRSGRGAGCTCAAGFN